MGGEWETDAFSERVWENDRAIAAPSASPPAPSGSAWGVKLLEWHEPSQATNGCWAAKSILGEFSVAFDDGWHASIDTLPYWEWEPEMDPRSYEGPWAAQMACQDHLNRTVGSALTPSPSYAEGIEAAALWHDDQAAQHDASCSVQPTGSDAWKHHAIAEAAHKRHAAAIRALADEVRG